MKDFDIFKDENLGFHQVRTKSFILTISFDDNEKEAIFNKIVSIAKTLSNPSVKYIRSKLSNSFDDSKVIEVLYNLKQNGLLEENIELPYNENGSVTESCLYQGVKPLNQCAITIYGDSPLANKICEIAKDNHCKRVVLKKFHNPILQEDIINSDFIIVDACCWSPHHIENINHYALKHNKPWIYIGGLEEDSIMVGPIFHGKESGCYKCLVSRIRSNSEYPDLFTSYELYLKKNQIASKPDSAIHYSLVINLIAVLSFIEVTKYIEGWAIPSTWRTVLKLNVHNMELSKHSLLKVPYCEECKPQLEYNVSPWLEAITLK